MAALFGSAVFVAQSAYAQEDVSISGGLTVVGQAISDQDYATNGTNNQTPAGSGNYDSPNANGAGITYSIDLAFEKEFFDGVAFLYLIGAEGVPVYDGSNADAEGDTFAGFAGVAEAWYKKNFFDDMFSVTLGKIDPTGIYDANEVANDQTTQFLADVFVNNKAILFPGYTPGVNFAANLGDIVAFSFGIFEDESTFDADGEVKIAGEFQKTFFIGELGLFYNLFDNPGAFRMTGWNSESADRSGFAFNLDQAMFGEAFSLFSRLGFVSNVDETVPETDLAFSIGGQLKFLDVHKFGVAYNLDSPSTDDDSISWFETYVDFEVEESVNVAFDLQMITNDSYDSSNDAVFVYGFRTQVSF